MAVKRIVTNIASPQVDAAQSFYGADGGPKARRNGNYRHGRYTAETIATRRWVRQCIRDVRALTKMYRRLIEVEINSPGWKSQITTANCAPSMPSSRAHHCASLPRRNAGRDRSRGRKAELPMTD